MLETNAPVQMDYEKEMTCSICTDILYKPLTLLDCLHTFCGACLKEWFRAQASRATSLHPYTCPSCRDSVRGTKHNAWVYTLVEMYLQQNPEKMRSVEEQREQDKLYKPGDNVLPKLRRRGRHREDDEEQRLVNQAMAVSLEDAGISTAPSEGNERRTRERSNTGERRTATTDNSPESRHVGMYLHSREEPRHRSRVSQRREASPTLAPDRLEHQSSLRSLLSGSEENIRNEIMRQIVEDGLLDDIDAENLTAAQEDEISTRIAAAWQEQRRRDGPRDRSTHSRRDRSARRSRNRSRHQSTHRPPAVDTQPEPRSQTQPSSPTAAATPEQVQSPVAVEQTVEVATVPDSTSNTRAQSPSSRSRQRSNTGGNPSHLRTQSAAGRPTSSHSNIETSRPEASQPEPSRPAQTSRRTTDPNVGRSRALLNTASSITQPATDQVLRPPTRSETGPASVSAPIDISPRLMASTFPLDISSARSSVSMLSSNAAPTSAPVELPATQETPLLYPEPSISCTRCGKHHIEYELHYLCTECDSNGFYLCLQCYRNGEGCLYWYGFGWGASLKYERERPPNDYPPGHEKPHILVASRFTRPTETKQSNVNGQIMITSPQDPRQRLESGVFCDICQTFANNWYWRCDICNDGEWGYCNSCVNHGHHCTHPLISLQATDSLTFQPDKPQISTIAPSQFDNNYTSLAAKSAQLIFIQRMLTTLCDYCKYPIPPSNTRYHCPQCNEGDYDMHTNCYISLVKSKQISHTDGHLGWRRCQNGHRMVILGFEDRDGGQKRIVVRDLVGGNALRDEDMPPFSPPVPTTSAPNSQPTSPHRSPQQSMGWKWRDSDGTERWHDSNAASSAQSHFPPDGGVGLRLLAKWGYFPATGVKDELMFPKGAEIKESADINGDWFWGVYAGKTGLLPGGYVSMSRRG